MASRDSCQYIMSLHRVAGAAGLEPRAAAQPAIVDGLGQALQAGAVQAASAALSAIVRGCVRAGGSSQESCQPQLLARYPGVVRALAAAAAGKCVPEAAYMLAPPLAAHVAKLSQAARVQACAAFGALVASPTGREVLLPCFGELAAAALAPSPVSDGLAGIVAALGQYATCT